MLVFYFARLGPGKFSASSRDSDFSVTIERLELYIYRPLTDLSQRCLGIVDSERQFHITVEPGNRVVWDLWNGVGRYPAGAAPACCRSTMDLMLRSGVDDEWRNNVSMARVVERPAPLPRRRRHILPHRSTPFDTSEARTHDGVAWRDSHSRAAAYISPSER